MVTPASSAPNRRENLRISCKIDAWAEFDTGLRLKCQTVDLSMVGGKLLFREDLKVARGHALERIELKGAGGYHVNLRWIKGLEAGFAFQCEPEERVVLGKLLDHLEKMRNKAWAAQGIRPPFRA